MLTASEFAVVAVAVDSCTSVGIVVVAGLIVVVNLLAEIEIAQTFSVCFERSKAGFASHPSTTLSVAPFLASSFVILFSAIQIPSRPCFEDKPWSLSLIFFFFDCPNLKGHLFLLRFVAFVSPLSLLKPSYELLRHFGDPSDFPLAFSCFLDHISASSLIF